jgi:peptidoglycan-N-acetylglucosamine deacetylase
LRFSKATGELAALAKQAPVVSPSHPKTVLEEESSKKTVIVTTSWDDGHRKDLKVAELLKTRKLPATFYVTSGWVDRPSHLTRAELRDLASAGFEIGGHSVSHSVLTELDASSLQSEVEDCKASLEAILGTELLSFAYPKGRLNAAVVNKVKRAGFRCARGVRMLSSSPVFPLFEMPVTIQAHPHSSSAYWRNLLRRGELRALAEHSIVIGKSKTWVELGKALFDRTLQKGGVWHLLGHSWETEKNDGWRELTEMLDYVSGRQAVRYLTNGELGQLVASTGHGYKRA